METTSPVVARRTVSYSLTLQWYEGTDGVGIFEAGDHHCRLANPHLESGYDIFPESPVPEKLRWALY